MVRHIGGTACVLFEGGHILKLSKNFFAAVRFQICQKILSKFDIKHRIAVKGLFPCLLERVVFWRVENDKIIDLAAGVLHYKFLLAT